MKKIFTLIAVAAMALSANAQKIVKMLMKKIFTLIAVAAMALSANAQKIVFDANEGLKTSYEVDGLKLEYVDTDSKMAVDANSQFFGTAASYENFKARFKTGAKSGAKSGITLTIPAAGTLKIAVRSASSSAEDRNLVLTQNETTLFDKVIKENEATDYETATIEEESKKVFPIQSVEVAAGTIEVTYPKGSLNFYCFELVSSSTAIQTVKAAQANDGAVFNLAGQKVGNDFKGIVIKNGKKMLQK